MIKTITTLKGRSLFILLMKNLRYQLIYMRLEEIDSKRRDIPIAVTMPFDILKSKLENKRLPTNVLYNVVEVQDLKSSNELMLGVKQYRR